MFRRSRFRLPASPLLPLLPSWSEVGPFSGSMGRYNVPIVKMVGRTDDLSEEDYHTLTQEHLLQLSQSIQRVKDVIYSSLLVSLGGLGTLSFLVLGDLISLGSASLALRISLSAFAVALPLLAAAYWNVKIWHGAAEPSPKVYRRASEAQVKQLGALRLYTPAPGRFPKENEPFTALVTELNFAGLLVILPAALVVFTGIVGALWHVFWIAAIAFVIAVIVGAVFIGRTAIYRLFKLRHSSHAIKSGAPPRVLPCGHAGW